MVWILEKNGQKMNAFSAGRGISLDGALRICGIGFNGYGDYGDYSVRPADDAEREAWLEGPCVSVYGEYLRDKTDFACFDAARRYYGYPDAADAGELNELLRLEYRGDAPPVVTVRETV